MCRRQIWAEMKALCQRAGVEPTGVFPHNLRPLCAATDDRAYKDIAKLTDVLGHSSIETTQIYMLTSSTITGTRAAKECEMPLSSFRYRAGIYEKGSKW